MNRIFGFISGFAAIIATVAIGISAGAAMSPDIIFSPGYEHGHALCGPPHEFAVRVPGIEHVDGKTYTIYVNKGHTKDPEVAGLHILAADACVFHLHH